MAQYMHESPVITFYIFLIFLVTTSQIIIAIVNKNKPIIKCKRCDRCKDDED